MCKHKDTEIIVHHERFALSQGYRAGVICKNCKKSASMAGVYKTSAEAKNEAMSRLNAFA